MTASKPNKRPNRLNGVGSGTGVAPGSGNHRTRVATGPGGWCKGGAPWLSQPLSMTCALIALTLATGLTEAHTAESSGGNTNRPRHHGYPNPDPSPARIFPEVAFRRGIGALRDRVEFGAEDGCIILRRRTEGGWSILLSGYPEQLAEPVRIGVTDSGKVQLDLGSFKASNEAPNPAPKSLRLLPHIALTKALRALRDRHALFGVIDFHEVRGAVSMRRLKESWYLRLDGYSNSGLGGIRIIVPDRGDVFVRYSS